MNQATGRKTSSKRAVIQDRYAILGYGSQGSALAKNLRDSGCLAIVGLPVGSKSRRRAKADGFTDILSVSKAAASATALVFAFPDHLHERVFKKDIAPNLKSSQALIFLHGMSVHFKLVRPPANVDVMMLAPHGPGLAVREKFISGKSDMSCFWAIDQDFSGKAKTRLFAFARAAGFKTGKKTALETTFGAEAIGDLFGEQAVLCGGLTELINAGFTTLTGSGLSADSAYLEVCYQLDLIVDLIKRFGIEGMYNRISVAAAYGSAKTGAKIINGSVKKRMKTALKEIESGRFARELSALTDKDISKLRKTLTGMSSEKFEKAARKFGK